MTIWELLADEKNVHVQVMINLGFYGLFSVKVHAIPYEPEAPLQAWVYWIYRPGDQSFKGWGRQDTISLGKDLVLL